MNAFDRLLACAAVAMLVGLVAFLVATPQAKAEVRVLHDREARRAANSVADDMGVHGRALMCIDRPGTSAAARTCLMSNGRKLRVRELGNGPGYLVLELRPAGGPPPPF